MQCTDIQINPDSRIPIYKQIADSVIDDLAHGKLKYGERIPSINQLSEHLLLSRDTVEKAYKNLKERKIIESVQGKGFYIRKTELISRTNVFFLINKSSTYKMMIYNAFVNALGINGHVSLFIYHCDESLFLNYLEMNLGEYDYYVIMPHFRDENLHHRSSSSAVVEILEKIPKDQLIILDNDKPVISGQYGAVYQDFKNDVYEALHEALEKLKNYDKIILVYPDKIVNPYPRRIVEGVNKFCSEHKLKFEIIDQIYEGMELQRRDVYITIQERDLVNLVRQIRKKRLKLGRDIGILSYNETPLKELLGISVISTDFEAMGETAAYMVLKKQQERVKNVFKYIARSSI